MTSESFRDTVAVVNFLDPRLPERFWSKCMPEPNSGCWLWLAASTRGYGAYAYSGSDDVRPAHRVTYETLVGAIPDGLVIDHLCRQPCCVNPSHMEPVTIGENVRRGDTRSNGSHNREKSACPSGHAYDQQNTYTRRNGGRGCIECRRDAVRKHRSKG